MSLVKTWYTPEEAAAKFGITKERIIHWVEQGVVRSEQDGKKVAWVNIDDVRLEVDNMVRQGGGG